MKKIMEDHNGDVILGVPDWLRDHEDWKDLGGANVSLVLRLDHPAARAA